MRLERGIKMPRKSSSIVALQDESILVWVRYARTFSLWQGIGLVKRISRGKEFDIIYVSFGIATNKQRPIVVVNSKPRRQILTLKCGQYAQFYGECFKKKEPRTFITKEGKEVKKDIFLWEFYAMAIQGWYMPKMFDVKKLEQDIENGEEKEQITPMSDKEEKAYEEQIKELLEKGLNNIDGLYEE